MIQTITIARWKNKDSEMYIRAIFFFLLLELLIEIIFFFLILFFHDFKFILFFL